MSQGLAKVPEKFKGTPFNYQDTSGRTEMKTLSMAVAEDVGAQTTLDSPVLSLVLSLPAARTVVLCWGLTPAPTAAGARDTQRAGGAWELRPTLAKAALSH